MRTPPPLAAAFAWNRVGLQWLEMMAASSQVIAHRTARSHTPLQWYAIGNEKATAGVESSLAMSRGMARLPQSSPLALWSAWARLMSAGMTPYRSRAVRNARPRR